MTDTMPSYVVWGTVFDNISLDLAPSLGVVRPKRSPDPLDCRDVLSVRRAIQRGFQEFRCLEYKQTPPEVGLAVRVR